MGRGMPAWGGGVMIVTALPVRALVALQGAGRGAGQSLWGAGPCLARNGIASRNSQARAGTGASNVGWWILAADGVTNNVGAHFIPFTGPIGRDPFAAIPAMGIVPARPPLVGIAKAMQVIALIERCAARLSLAARIGVPPFAELSVFTLYNALQRDGLVPRGNATLTAFEKAKLISCRFTLHWGLVHSTASGQFRPWICAKCLGTVLDRSSPVSS